MAERASKSGAKKVSVPSNRRLRPARAGLANISLRDEMQAIKIELLAEMRAIKIELLAEMRAIKIELLAEIHTLRQEVRVLQVQMGQVQTTLAQVQADVARMLVLMEEQNARNKVVLDGLAASFARHERTEERLDALEKRAG